jgi:hypothetical protein
MDPLSGDCLHDKCINTSGDAVERSPLRSALRAHFQNYSGLVEPRLEIAAVALAQSAENEPQRDDL